MEDITLLDKIETHMMMQKTHRCGIDLKIVSEIYYPKINRFVVIYEPTELNDGVVEKVCAQTIEKGFDRLTTESYLRAYRKNMREINRLFPKLAAKLKELKKYEFIEELWRVCNYKEPSKRTGDMDEFAVFYSEEANGIPLIPISQTIHENKLVVVYYPIMDSKQVDSRLIREEDCSENIDFNRL